MATTHLIKQGYNSHSLHYIPPIIPTSHSFMATLRFAHPIVDYQQKLTTYLDVGSLGLGIDVLERNLNVLLSKMHFSRESGGGLPFA